LIYLVLNGFNTSLNGAYTRIAETANFQVHYARAVAKIFFNAATIKPFSIPSASRHWRFRFLAEEQGLVIAHFGFWKLLLFCERLRA
jgi:hypothetical protein